MDNQLFAVDVGNAYVKAVGGAGEARFIHAIKELSVFERDQVQQGIADGLPAGYAIVNDRMYAYGEVARRHVAITRHGAQRYDRHYYGVLMAIGLALVGASGQVDLMASYAPRDVHYKKELIASATGQWRVRVSNQVQAFTVLSVMPFDEPFGGYCRHVLKRDGMQNKSNRVRTGDLLVIDPGGFTTDAIIASGDTGLVDFTSASSIESGAEAVLQEYENLLRSTIAELRMTTNLSVVRLQASLISGEYSIGGRVHSTKKLATQAKAEWLSDVAQLIHRFGLGNYDAILLTGGGGMLIYNDLKSIPEFSKMQFVLVDPDDLQMANVRGGYRFGKLLSRVGIQA